MPNFYNDNKALKLHLQHPLMKKIVSLKERDFADADKYDYAPVDFADAMDNYERVLEIVGDLCANIIADNAEGVDHDGPSLANGRVTYAEGTQRNLDACRKEPSYRHRGNLDPEISALIKTYGLNREEEDYGSY